MRSFDDLKYLSQFDFTQMRGLGNRATDESLNELSQRLRNFFEPFNHGPTPTIQELEHYNIYMFSILERINEAEYHYFLNKYRQEYPDFSTETQEKMAKLCRFNSYKELPRHLAYWFAGEHFGDIRLKTELQFIAYQMRRWHEMIERVQEPQQNDENDNAFTFAAFQY